MGTSFVRLQPNRLAEFSHRLGGLPQLLKADADEVVGHREIRLEEGCLPEFR